MRVATYREFINNSNLYFGLDSIPAHWEYDEERGEYIVVMDCDNNRLIPRGASSLRELFYIHYIRFDERSLLV